jgi:N-(2-amino-2-carboxyethyl)-L-glutamate synthase
MRIAGAAAEPAQVTSGAASAADALTTTERLLSGGAPRSGRLTVAPSILATIGNTPLIRVTGFLDEQDVALYLKLEAANPGGSVKDRPARRMLEQAIRTGRVGPDTVVVESSSGNTGIGLAQVCAYYGLRFVCVVDGRTQPHNLAIMRALGAELVAVDAPLDGSVDLLTARLERVTGLLAELDDAFWPNQYANTHNPRAHQYGTMAEIDAALGGAVHDLFVAVSSTGTIGGCVDHLARHDRRTRVVAVDAEGSVLFGGDAGRRVIPGLGAGRIPSLAIGREVDEVARVSDLDCVVGCRRLALTDAMLVGGSAGGALQVVRSRQAELRGRTCVVVAADSGHRYLDTVFDDDWVEQTLGTSPGELADLVGPPPGGRL